MTNGRLSLPSYLAAMVLVGALVVGGIIAVSYLNPGRDNTATIVVIIAFGGTLLTTVPTFLKAQESAEQAQKAVVQATQSTLIAEKTGQAVDGQMERFRQVLREMARAEVDTVRAEGKAETMVAQVAAARAEGQVEMAKQVIASIPATPQTTAITNGDHAVKVELVPGHEVGDNLIVPPGGEKKP